MKVAVIPQDKTVYKDGVSMTNLTLPTCPADIHAAQWNTETGSGWIEFSDNLDGTKSKPNETLTAIPDWLTDAMNEFDTAKAQKDADQAAAIATFQAARAAAAANTATTTTETPAA
jgi:hypothetical protein